MASAQMTLDDGHGAQQVTLTSKNFSQAEETAFLDRNQTNLYDKLDNAGFNTSMLVVSDTITVGPVQVDFYKTTAGPYQRYDDMKKAVRRAIEMVNQDPALVFPNNLLRVFCAEAADLSLGYRYNHNGREHAAITLGRTAVQAAMNPNTKTVAEEVAAYYNPTFSVDSLDRRICTTALHEMGHVFHQIQHLEYYITLARVAELAGQAIDVPSVTAQMGQAHNLPKQADFNPVPTAAQLYQFVRHTLRAGAGVSYYANFSGLNEVVAEVFSALMMGSPVGNDQGVDTNLLNVQANNAEVMATYGVLQGPVPAVAARHVRTRSAAKDKLLNALGRT